MTNATQADLTTIKIPKDLHTDLKVEAARRRVKLGTFVTDALREKVATVQTVITIPTPEPEPAQP